MDCIINAIKDRFDQEDFKTYIKLEKFFLKVAKGSDFDSENNDVMALYDNDFDGIRFHTCNQKRHQGTVKKLLTLDLFVP